MVYSLENKVVLISGSSAGLGAVLADAFAAEGCHIVLNHSSPSAVSTSRAHTTLAGLQTKYPTQHFGLICADCAEEADNVRLVRESIELAVSWGLTLNGVIANAGWTRFSDIADLNAPRIEDFDRCFAVNVKSPFVLLREAKPVMEKNEDGGFFIMTSSVAGENAAGSSLAYCVSKAANLHLMRCLAQHQGPKIRVNAVKPGVLPTEWGLMFGRERLNQIISGTVLKTETTLENCALVFVMLAKNDSITGQAVQIDGGQFI
ncbi:uncharacterized protein V1518DRAFT_419712 [Limtongia smithiae]|uniref:uncharacterized protein n=1 Tax=Limtongia smithiae TaxID=1125753 RepID=UPI0034CE548A